MTPFSALLSAFLISALLVAWIHPYSVKIARLKNIVDKPDARKLQRLPVPVLGGVAVFFGIVLGLGIVSPFVESSPLLIVIVALTAMLYIGTMDDILNLSPGLRFVVEIVVVLLLIFVGGYVVDDFQGLWGLGRIPLWAAVPLTVFGSVGIINAINLIDGVNGLSSGYCIAACTLFGVHFHFAGNAPMSLLAAVSAGALLPFFLHNVFGKSSRMFIGDGGTVVMGTVMSIFVSAILGHDSPSSRSLGPTAGLVPFTLAVLSIPVFDTLRVMSRRLLRGRSPFQPDKTHLHHIFIELGCSHPAVTLAILVLNFSVVVVWLLLVKVGVSIGWQLVGVVLQGIAVTFGVYDLLAWHLRRNTRFLRRLRRLGYHTHFSRRSGFLRLQKFVDKH